MNEWIIGSIISFILLFIIWISLELAFKLRKDPSVFDTIEWILKKKELK